MAPAGQPAPLLLSEHEIATSNDCFAIEFHDMRRQHRLLFGKDVVTPLAVDDSFYRAQVEHELRAKLLRLRQKAAGMLSDPDLLRRLLVDSISTFCVLFRHALILHGEDGPATKRDAIARVRGQVWDRCRAFRPAAGFARGADQARAIWMRPKCWHPMKGISTVIDAVDQVAR